VAICTYNRPIELGSCLESLKAERSRSSNFHILIVDNYGCEQTRHLADQFFAEYIREYEVGLSLARNRAWQVCQTPWILYLDDDAKMRPGGIAETHHTIHRQLYQVFGGRFVHWFKTPPPKWFPKEFEQNGRPNDAKELTTLPQDDYLFGGIIAFKKEILVAMGGFDPTFGMQGKALGYGEENDLQIRLRANNITIGYNPNIVIDHLVGLHKYQLFYHLKAAYLHGLSNAKVMQGEYFGFFDFLRAILYTIFVRLSKGLAKMVVRKGYYWQNLVIEVIGLGILRPYGCWQAASVK